MAKMREICTGGATVLFVSHAPVLVSELCDRAIWLKGGQLNAIGPALNVCKAYEYEVWKRTEQANWRANAARREREETASVAPAEPPTSEVLDTGRYVLDNSDLKIRSVRLFDADGQEKYLFTRDERLRIRVAWEGSSEYAKIWFGMRLDDERGVTVSGFEGWESGWFLNDGKPISGRGEFEVEIPTLHLGQGTFYISCSLSRYMLPSSKERILHYIEKVVKFSVRRKLMADQRYTYEPDYVFRELSYDRTGA